MGFTYGDFYHITSDDDVKTRTDFFDPNVQIGFEYLFNKYLYTVTSVGYGNTFLFFDQTPFKYYITSGAIYTPWDWLTLQLGFGTYHFRDVSEWEFGPVGTALFEFRS